MSIMSQNWEKTILFKYTQDLHKDTFRTLLNQQNTCTYTLEKKIMNGQ